MPSATATATATATALDLDAAPRLRVLVGRLGRRLRSTRAGSTVGLTPTGISVFLTVVREGPIRLSELASAESLNPTMLSRAVSGLVESGMLARVSDGGDRRAAWVEATPAGHTLAERMRRERTDALGRALSALGDEDRRLIEQALPALEALAEQLKEPSA